MKVLLILHNFQLAFWKEFRQNLGWSQLKLCLKQNIFQKSDIGV